MAECLDIGFCAALCLEARIFENSGVGGFAPLLTGRGLHDLRGDSRRLRLHVRCIVGADARRGDAAQVLGPNIFRLAPLMAECLDIGFCAALRLDRLILEDRRVGGLSRLLTVRRSCDLGRRLNGLGLHMLRIAGTDAGDRHAAHIIRPFKAWLLPEMAQRSAVLHQAIQRLKGLVPEGRRIDTLPRFGAGRSLCDLRHGLGDLRLNMGGVVCADTRRDDTAQILGPFVFGLAPRVAKSLRQRFRTGLRRENTVRKLSAENGLSRLGTCRAFRLFSGRLNGLTLGVRRIIPTDAQRRNAAQILGPLVDRLSPLMAERVSIGLPAFRTGLRFIAGGRLPAVLMTSTQRERHDENQQHGKDPFHVAHSSFVLFSFSFLKHTPAPLNIQEKSGKSGGKPFPLYLNPGRREKLPFNL